MNETNPEVEADEVVMLTAPEVCAKFGIRYYRLEYLLRSGQVQKPRQFGRSRVFTASHLDQIERLLSKA